jgi:holo-ACP synthase/triphosphoribosyl-dephospho-CoA synthase
MNEVLDKLLKAREQRAKIRLDFAENNQSSLSLNFNIPGIPKSNNSIHSCFKKVLADLKRHLISYRIHFDSSNEHSAVDEAGDFYIVPIHTSSCTANEIKEITEKFEELHPLGRLLDVDITDINGNPISSGKAKLCYYCKEKPAIQCMREQNHSYYDLREKIDKDIVKYLNSLNKDKVCKFLAANALKSLIHEVALSPKPGLVDRFSNGSHKDMDFASFINSASVLSVYFKDIAQYGFSYSSNNLIEALPELRKIGLLMEEDMFKETNGVNTHKGAIFLLGFSLFISAYLIAKNNFSYNEFVKLIKELNGDLVEKELGQNLYSSSKTHGEICYERYGHKGKGIRGEIQAGLPCVFQYAIPSLEVYLSEETIHSDKLIQKALTHALLALISKNNDSNVLFRKGEEVLEKLKEKASLALNYYETEKFETYYQDLINFCETNQISPGGSADLLAVSYFIYTTNMNYSSVSS